MALRKPTVVSNQASTTQAADPVVETKAQEAEAAVETHVNEPEARAAEGVVTEAHAEVVTEQQTGEQVLVDAETAVELAEPEQATQVAVVREEASAVAVVEPGAGERARGAMSAYIREELAAEGFEDLELTGFSFDRIKLHEGKFKLGTEEVDLGEEFDCVIHSTRGIYVVRQSGDEDAEVYYSYDPEGKTLSDGSSAAELLEKWREEGYATEDNPVDVKKYLEVMVTLTNRDDEYNDTMASLSIPPASRDRLAGAAAMAKQKYKCSPNGVITKCKVGKKTGEGKKAFRPWVFQVVGLVG